MTVVLGRRWVDWTVSCLHCNSENEDLSASKQLWHLLDAEKLESRGYKDGKGYDCTDPRPFLRLGVATIHRTRSKQEAILVRGSINV